MRGIRSSSKRFGAAGASMFVAIACAGCAHAPPIPPAPLPERLAPLRAARPAWEFPDTTPDTLARHMVEGDATGDGIPDRAFLITRGDSAVIYFAPGTGRGMYGAVVEVARTDQLDQDVLFILNGDLAFGHRNSDDFIAWHWNKRKHRFKLRPEAKPGH